MRKQAEGLKSFQAWSHRENNRRGGSDVPQDGLEQQGGEGSGEANIVRDNNGTTKLNQRLQNTLCFDNHVLTHVICKPFVFLNMNPAAITPLSPASMSNVSSHSGTALADVNLWGLHVALC